MRRSSRSSGRGPGLRRFLPWVIVFLVLAIAPALALAQTTDSVVVSWSAPGDDGAIGTATSYDLRVSEAPITAANFSQALVVPGMPAPLVSGTAQSVTVYGLTRSRNYYFAIRTADNKGNWSALSNVVLWDWNIDTSPPQAPQGVRATRETDGIHVDWRANTEADLAGYNLYRSINGLHATRLNNALVTGTEFTDTQPPASGQSVVYQVTAVDQRGNESARALVSQINVLSASDWKLEPGYPNPSRLGESVRIPVVIPASVSGNVTLRILDAAGRPVRELVIPSPTPGTTEVAWDGLNDAGRATAPGVYRGWLVAGSTRMGVRLLRVP